MTKVDKILLYIKEHPNASNQEIGEALGMCIDYVKAAISTQKNFQT